ncbi:TonB-dependent siderophore receptor [Pseudomonas matsuisoli]|nr:TonB-dependent siderophore receptor [Pseudomonas matsuisoli]
MRRIAICGGVFAAICFEPVVAGQALATSQEQAATEALELEALTISDEASASVETEGSGSYTTGKTSAATKLPLSLRETPQSVTVMTRQHMDDQKLRTVKDVLENTTGMSANTLDYRSTYYARGFSVDSYQFDGIPTTFVNGANYLDTAFYDRVEIVRGSTGLLTGAGNPSASINMVRKRPTYDFQGEVSVDAGSWDNYRSTVDLSTPLTEDGRIRARVVGVRQDSHSYVDGFTEDKNAFYGIVEADLTDDTTLGVGYDYQEIMPRGMLWGGLPMFYSDGSRTDWSRSKSLAADWSKWDNTLSTAFTSLEHRFDNGWSLRGVFNQGRTHSESELFGPEGYPDKATGIQQVNALASRSKARQNSVDVMASGPFALFGRDHELVVGAMESRRVSDEKSTSHLIRKTTLAPIDDVYNYNGNYPKPDFDAAGYDSLTNSTIKQSGVYVASRFSLAAPLTMIVGGRLNDYSYESDTSVVSIKKNDKFIPYIGLVYDLDKVYSVYASHTGIFNPQTQRDLNGDVLQPTEGTTNEVGIKAAYFGGKLNSSLAFFETKQDNVAQQDPDHRTPEGGTAYVAASGTKSRGFDLDLQGEITPSWNMFAGISHFTATDGEGARLSTAIPRTTAKLFTTYQLSGALSRLTVGGGVNWQSQFYQEGSSPLGRVKMDQESYALASLMARYDLTEQTTLSMNVNNLFDKEYYQMVGFYSQAVYGAPRNLLFSLSYKL